MGGRHTRRPPDLSYRPPEGASRDLLEARRPATGPDLERSGRRLRGPRRVVDILLRLCHRTSMERILRLRRGDSGGRPLHDRAGVAAADRAAQARDAPVNAKHGAGWVERDMASGATCALR